MMEMPNVPPADPLLVKIVGRYLRYDDRYDRWGRFGKMIVVQEVLREEGIALSFDALQRIVNEVFPRTFPYRRRSPVSAVLMPYVRNCYFDQLLDFSLFSLGEGAVVRETSERFHYTESAVRQVIGSSF